MTTDHYPIAPSAWVMQQSLSWPDNSQVLDFACGYGRHSLALAKRFNVLAVDQNPHALAICAGHEKITICEYDLETGGQWPFIDRTFDAVVITNYLYRPKLSLLFGLVAPGGFLAYETFAVGNEKFGHPKNPNFLLREGELASNLPTNFTMIDRFHDTVCVPKPAVIQRLAARRNKVHTTVL